MKRHVSINHIMKRVIHNKKYKKKNYNIYTYKI
jgi:hypothetical protein